MKKWLKTLVIVAVVVIVVAIVVVALTINQAVRKGIEVGGTMALGVPTKVDAVSIGFLSSSVAIKGFQIGNPQGFQTDRLMALGLGKVACSIPSLLSDQIVVKEIIVDAPELTVELKPGLPPKSNIGDLMNKLKSDKAKPAPAPTPAPKPTEAKKPGKSFKVDLIRVTKTTARFHLIGGKTASVVLPDIEMKEVKNSDGTPLMLADILQQVLESMGTSALKNAKGVIPDDALAGLDEAMGSAKKIVTEGKKAVDEAAGKLKDEAGKVREQAGKMVEGLFGGKKKPEEKK